MAKKPKDDPWKQDYLQFARLLCELRAVGALSTQAVYERLLENMDLEQEDLERLFDRAHLVWELRKKQLTVDPRSTIQAKLPGGEHVELIGYLPAESRFRVCPRGGGRTGSVPSDRVVPLGDSDIPRFVRSRVGINGEVYFDCWLDPNDRWNGWACPMFEKEVIEGPIRKYIEDGNQRLVWVEAEKRYDVYEEGETEPSTFGGLYRLRTPDGREVDTWDIGARCWVWMDDEDEPVVEAKPAG